VPIARACVRAGHEVVVAAQRQHRANVERAGLPFSPVGDPPEHEWMPLMDRFADLDVEAANALMIGEFFAGIDTRAGLPDLLSTVRAWAPDSSCARVGSSERRSQPSCVAFRWRV
jgi:hypothetical protein